MRIGDRVALAPHLDLWMRGARFGNVVKIGTQVQRDPGSEVVVQSAYIKVKVDGVARIHRFLPGDVEVIK